MANRNRTNPVQFYLSDDEQYILTTKFKASGIIKEYHSDDYLDYAKILETLGTIYLMTANHSKAKTHLKKAFKIDEKIWTDEPEMIEAKYQEIQELYPQVGSFLGQQISNSLTKQA